MLHTLGPLIAYHGCDRSTGEDVLAGRTDLRPSLNVYDWLGPGVYFWAGSATRGLDWAQEVAVRSSTKIRDPFVIGALINPQHCLSLIDYGALPEVRAAYDVLEAMFIAAGRPMPENTAPRDGLFMRRALDCAVIKMGHQLRALAARRAFDTVYGVFEEGGALYPGAGFKLKTHVQIAVRNLDCIVGYFRVPKIGKLTQQDRAA
jgi:hypothetical protein